MAKYKHYLTYDQLLSAGACISGAESVLNELNKNADDLIPVTKRNFFAYTNEGDYPHWIVEKLVGWQAAEDLFDAAARRQNGRPGHSKLFDRQWQRDAWAEIKGKLKINDKGEAI